MNQQLFQELSACAQHGQTDSGLVKVNEYLEEKPDDATALFFAGLFHLKQENKGLALPCFEKSLALKPDQPETLNNMGVCLYQGQHYETAKEIYLKAYELNKKDPDILSNLVSVEVGMGNNHQAIDWAKKCLKLDPGNGDALYNSALAYLSVGKYEEGWKRYDVSLGNKYRQERFFDPEQVLPRWEGEEFKDGDVVVYGEQGLGDEIMFASILPDAMKKAHIILECDRRLLGLFKRSFPELTVYPTRWDDQIMWPTYHHVKAKCEAGHLGRLFRPTKESFPRKKYLVADPERRKSYRALLDQFEGKKVGIAWTGGRASHDQKQRNIPLEELTPLLKTEGVQWVDLEYHDRSLDIARYMQDTGIGINHFPWITLHEDYDCTAALVAELDLVIATSTTVVELAGALGVPCIQFTPNVPTWRVGPHGKRHPWYEGVTVLRKEGEEWQPHIEEAKQCMLSLFASQAATTDPVA